MHAQLKIVLLLPLGVCRERPSDYPNVLTSRTCHVSNDDIGISQYGKEFEIAAAKQLRERWSGDKIPPQFGNDMISQSIHVFKIWGNK